MDQAQVPPQVLVCDWQHYCVAAAHQLRVRGVEQRVEQAPDSKPVEVDQAVQKTGGHSYAGVEAPGELFFVNVKPMNGGSS